MWPTIWTVPDHIKLDVNQGYHITFAVDPDQTIVATSALFFLGPENPKASSSSGSSTQGSASEPSAASASTSDTTLSTGTLPVSSTTSVVLPPGSKPNSNSSGIDGSGLSKGASAGVAIGIAAFLALIILGGSKLYRPFKERLRGKQGAEGHMVFWDGRGSASNVRDERVPDGRAIENLGHQSPGVQQLGGVELQPLSNKAAEVLGLEKRREARRK